MCNVDNTRHRHVITTVGVKMENIMAASPQSMTPEPVMSEETVGLTDAIKTQQKHCVQHNYHDHAFDSGDSLEADKPMVSKGGVTVPFPLKLHDMLEHIELNEPELADIVSWQPHGRCFLVHKPKLFAEMVLQRFFQQKKYASFQRQLNLYGFNRITKGPDRGSYYHELFLRGKKFLCRGINRMKIKGTGARMASNPEAEPDFYQMIPMGESVDAPFSSAADLCPPDSAVLGKSPVPARVESLPPLKEVTSNFVSPEQSDDSYEQEHIEYVFGNMPFHSIDRSQESRRHSLMIVNRQNTLGYDGFRKDSLVTPSASDDDLCSNEGYNMALRPQPDDEIFFREMDLISSLGNSNITDSDMVNILDRIIH
jgi:Heat shock transcription factor